MSIFNNNSYITFLTGDLIGALGYGLTSFFVGAGFSSLFNNKLKSSLLFWRWFNFRRRFLRFFRYLLFGALRDILCNLLFLHVILTGVAFTPTATSFTVFFSFRDFNQLLVISKFLKDSITIKLEVCLIHCYIAKILYRTIIFSSCLSCLLFLFF